MIADKITPGDWITDGGCHVQALYTPADGGKPFWHTIARTDQPLVSGEQAGANARLFANSNKLLKAVERIKALSRPGQGLDIHQAIEVIASIWAEAEFVTKKGGP